jgi:hypothetical protein
VNTTAVDLKASTVGGSLDVTATTGDITDSGTITVGGDACFNAANDITLDQLAVVGSIGLIGVNATIVNATAIDFKTTSLSGNLDATATTGAITQSDSIEVAGTSNFVTAADLVCLTGDNDFGGAVSATGTTVEIVDRNDLTIGTITGAVDDLFFRAGAGGLGALDISDNLTVTGAAGQILLQAASGVTQAAGTVVTAPQLLLGGDAAGEGSGTFNLNGANLVDRLAAQLQNDLVFVNAQSVEIADLDYSSACGTAEAICGLNIGGNLETTITGAISQTAAIVVQGTSDIRATETICLTGADCDGDGLNDNDFVGVVNAAGTTVEIVDRNDLIAGTITAVDDVFLRSGDNGLGALTLTGNVTTTIATGQVLLQSDSGVTQTAGVISTSELLLGGDLADEGSGVFNLSQANQVGQLGADLQSDLVFNNVQSLEIADLVYVSVCGTTEAICGLRVVGNLDLDVVGALTQSASILVQGDSTIDATQEVCLTGGDCDGDGLNDNDFVGTVSATGSTVEIVDRNALVVGDVVATDDVFLRSGDNGSGALTLDGDVTTTSATGQVLLQSDNGATQSAGSVITANDLLVGGDAADEGTGVFDLSGNNVVNNLAANVVGELRLDNTIAIVVDSLSYSSACLTTEAINGVTATDKIRIEASGITLNQAVTSDTVFLVSDNGVTQNANGVITSTNLMLQGMGSFGLDNANNDTDFLAADIVGSLDYFDVDEVTVATLTCDGETICGLGITGDLNLTTNNGDLFQNADAAVIVGGNTILDVGTGNICLTGGDCNGDGINDNLFGGTLTLVAGGDVVIAENDDVSIDSVSGGGSYRFIGNNIQINTAIVGNQLLLEASNGVDYNGNLIDVTDLMLVGAGTFDFGVGGETANSIDNLAADIDGDLNLINSTAIDIGNLTFVSVCGNVTVCGVNIDAGGGLAGNLELRILDADLTQSASIAVEGTSFIDVGTGDICLTGADCDGDGINDNDFVGQVDAVGSTVELVDRNDLTVGNIIAVDDIFLRAGDGDTGSLSINGDLTTNQATGQVLLQSDVSITQNAASVVTANDLLIGSSTITEVQPIDAILGGQNSVNNLAVRLDGDLTFSNTIDLNVGDLAYSSACGTAEAICGIELLGGGNLNLTLANASLSQTAAVVVDGTTIIDVGTGDVCLTGGDCDGDGLNDNDFVGLVTVTGNTVELVDINDLNVGDINAVDDIYLRAGDGATTGTLTIDGNLVTDQNTGQVLLQSDTAINQSATTSVITANDLLIGSQAVTDVQAATADLSGQNSVNNVAARLDADLTLLNTRDLNIGDLSYASACGTTEAICGIELLSGGNFDLTLLNNSLSQSAAIIVTGTTEIDAGTGIVCLTGADCDGDGINDNDFVGQVDVVGATVELVDRNDLTVGNIVAVDDVYLRAGDGATGTLTINGNLTTDQAAGQALLQSDSGIVQAATSIITANDLLVGSPVVADAQTGNVLLIGQNSVNRFAAGLNADLTLVNTRDLEIAELDYQSACLTSETICGVELSPNGDLNLTLVDASLTQSAAVIVGGNTQLDVGSGTICLTGADCDGDGINDNDFVGQVDAVGATIELVDRNDLTVGNILAVDDVFLRAGDGATGTLTINGDVTTDQLTGQVLLQSDTAIVQNAASVITANELLVGSALDADTRGGSASLIGQNQVNQIAVGLDNDFTFTNTRDLNVGDLSYDSACGTTEAICGIELLAGGSLELNLIDVSLTQTASVIVSGTTEIDAGAGTICLTGADCDGDGVNDNDFVGQVDAIGSTVELVDRNALTVGDIVAVDDIYLRAGDGGAGALAINGALTTDQVSGQVLLQSDTSIVQNAASVITANDLLVGSSTIADVQSGNAILIGQNSVNNIAARLNADLTIVNTLDLTIADLTYDSSCDTNESICGIELRSGGSLDVTLVDASLDQSAAVIVEGTTQIDAGDGTICLTGGDCDGDGINDNDFVGQVDAIGTTVELVDRNALTVGDITSVDDIYLRAGDGDSGALTINGNLTTNQATGQVLLQSDTAINQNAAASVITANDLLVGSDSIGDAQTGSATLDGQNSVNRLAARLDASLSLTNTIDLEIADLDYNSVCGTTEAICGVDLQSGGDFRLTLVDASLTQTAAVIVTGASQFDAGTGTICLTGADCDGDGLNDNDFVGQVVAIGSTVELVDINDLNVGDILAVDDIYLRAGDVAAGTLTIDGNLTTNQATGQVLLQSDTAINQNAATSVITANDLLIGSETIADVQTGSASLDGANSVNRIAARLDNDLSVTNVIDLEVADLNYDSACGTTEAICGIELQAGGNLSLVLSDASLSQTAAVIVSGTTDIAVGAGDICLTGGDCTGDGLNDNDFVGLVTASGNTIELVDINDLTTGNILGVQDVFLRAGDGLASGTLTLSGDVTVNQGFGQVLLQSDTAVAQNAATSVITANQLMLGGNDADEATGLYSLVGENEVDRLAGNLFDGSIQFVNGRNLTIEALSYTSVCSTAEAFTELRTQGDDALQSEIVLDSQLAQSIQADGRYNDGFDEFLNSDGGGISDIGIAIDNEGSVENNVAVTAEQGDILIQTHAADPLLVADDITVNETIQVNQNANNILIVAGGDLELNGPLVRGTEGLVLFETNINAGTPTVEFPDGVLVLDPGSISVENAIVDATTLTQDVEYIFAQLTEQMFTTSVFWGIDLAAYDGTTLVPDFAIFDSMDVTTLGEFENLLFSAMVDAGFESKSFYADPFAGGIASQVTSQEIGNTFDNSGTVNDSGVPTAAFTRSFLRDNPEFRNVMFVFNDAQINIFEGASDNNANGVADDLVDLNVAVEDFQGLARIGQPPVVEVQRTEFQVPERVEITNTATTEFFDTVVTDESPLLVQTVRESFFVVVYFESQYEADLFESRFEDLADDESGENDFDIIKEKILQKAGLEYLQWESEDGNNSLDANQIREILERAVLDLGEDEEWIDKYENWLKEQDQDSKSPPNVPRGVFKIIEVDNGKAVIQGDDVDRRFVPEPEEDSEPEQQPSDDIKNDNSSYTPESIETNRVARWEAMLGGDSVPAKNAMVDFEAAPISGVASAVGSSLSAGLAAMLCRQNSATKQTARDEIESLSQCKAENPERNVFSKASRFKRRNEFVATDEKSAE